MADLRGQFTLAGGGLRILCENGGNEGGAAGQGQRLAGQAPCAERLVVRLDLRGLVEVRLEPRPDEPHPLGRSVAHVKEHARIGLGRPVGVIGRGDFGAEGDGLVLGEAAHGASQGQSEEKREGFHGGKIGGDALSYHIQAPR